MTGFEQAIWATARPGGDVDTTCAIVGGIVAARLDLDDLPGAWLEATEPLPHWLGVRVRPGPSRGGRPLWPWAGTS
ncbi:ADP-ribosylglycohydrolase family protein [Thermomonospora cellulosilytica]|uniref:ADP-ribosylglycohydrolase family protein n=1 Tax=Thermomonospora cellulosilytica TaxID=1411118 RepID=UPI001FE80E6D|nr:ADP-ribosylglycohydrolase family protein [Thermomonospora cellulosilytica]